MSFMKTLATVAIGFATAKGLDRYKQMGGMAGMKDMFGAAGTNPAADQLAALSKQFGLPSAEEISERMGQWGGAGTSAAAAGAAGLASLMNAMRSAAQAGSAQSADMMSAMFAGTPAQDFMEAQAKMMLRAMIQAAKADGDIDADEKAAIMDQLGEGIGAEERAFVQEQMDAPLDVQALANDAGEHMREQIYATSLAAIRVDTTGESTYLIQLARALGLSDEARDRIHEQMGVSSLGK